MFQIYIHASTKKKKSEKTQNPRNSQSRTLHTTGRNKAWLIEVEIQRFGAEFSYRNTSVTERSVKTFQIATVGQRNSHKNCTQPKVSLKNEDDVAPAQTIF